MQWNSVLLLERMMLLFMQWYRKKSQLHCRTKKKKKKTRCRRVCIINYPMCVYGLDVHSLKENTRKQWQCMSSLGEMDESETRGMSVFSSYIHLYYLNFVPCACTTYFKKLVSKRNTKNIFKITQALQIRMLPGKNLNLTPRIISSV